ncbi:hypothetical protein LCGC14_2212470 [marine sediment metagenome]|uniref:Uncharacterized protein n=1 Tax=marine sediment metagenome TaxID=412755 RepID=A0A0F9G912_9ZZZZ
MIRVAEVNKTRRELDAFNLEVAKWRAESGMVHPLIELYRDMGIYDRNLLTLVDTVAMLECSKENMEEHFAQIQEEYK